MTIDSVGILGAGVMGTAIAQVFSKAGFHVTLYDIDDSQLERARIEIESHLERQVDKAALTEYERNAAQARVHFTRDFGDFQECGLIVESVTEDEGMKRRTLREISPHLSPDTIIATNTSSISITRLATATDRPDRFIGMHFMKPVSVMDLVEVIRGIATSDETFRTVQDIVLRIGKQSAQSEDFPAFIVNRLLLPMINEAVYALYEGVGSVGDIDKAMRLGAHHPMGPLELADFIGLDRVLSIMQTLHEGLSDSKYRPCPLLVKYVEAGWIGKTAGRGFYDYRSGIPVPTR
jgi:3-hydroxybutyryl-CoA dehydrogenase